MMWIKLYRFVGMRMSFLRWMCRRNKGEWRFDDGWRYHKFFCSIGWNLNYVTKSIQMKMKRAIWFVLKWIRNITQTFAFFSARSVLFRFCSCFRLNFISLYNLFTFMTVIFHPFKLSGRQHAISNVLYMFSVCTEECTRQCRGSHRGEKWTACRYLCARCECG